MANHGPRTRRAMESSHPSLCAEPWFRQRVHPPPAGSDGPLCLRKLEEPRSVELQPCGDRLCDCEERRLVVYRPATARDTGADEASCAPTRQKQPSGTAGKAVDGEFLAGKKLRDQIRASFPSQVVAAAGSDDRCALRPLATVWLGEEGVSGRGWGRIVVNDGNPNSIASDEACTLRANDATCRRRRSDDSSHDHLTSLCDCEQDVVVTREDEVDSVLGDHPVQCLDPTLLQDVWQEEPIGVGERSVLVSRRTTSKSFDLLVIA